MIEFPKGFFWGAANSAYQVEGNNISCDWWEWEKRAGLKDLSGYACRHYDLYREDFDLARDLNHNSHRLSIEWSRIEPQEGKFSKEALKHYIDVIISLRERNIEPVVTLHHFTNPLWFAELGGWSSAKSGRYFARYVEYVVPALADKVKYWVTINEPLVYTYFSYVTGTWPPQEKSLFKAKFVQDNFAGAHLRSYRLIHQFYKGKGLPFPCVSIAHNMQAFVPCSPTLKDKTAVYLRERFFNFSFIERLIRYRSLDFIGLNYYSRSLVEVEKWGLMNLAVDVCKRNHHPLKKNAMGWDIYPQGLYELLLRLKKHNLPVFILENGVCVDDDALRWDFIYQHLKSAHLAMSEGVNVLGYLYWSLLDNFEWDKGFWPRFGLIDVDYHTYKRTVRESAKKFSLVCKTGRLE